MSLDLYDELVHLNTKKVLQELRENKKSYADCYALACLAMAQTINKHEIAARATLEIIPIETCTEEEKAIVLEAQWLVNESKKAEESSFKYREREAKAILTLNPRAVFARRFLAELYLFQEEISKGMQVFEGLQRDYPDLDWVKIRIAQSLISRRRYPEAIAVSKSISALSYRLAYQFIAGFYYPYLNILRVLWAILLLIPGVSTVFFLFIISLGAVVLIIFFGEKDYIASGIMKRVTFFTLIVNLLMQFLNNWGS